MLKISDFASSNDRGVFETVESDRKKLVSENFISTLIDSFPLYSIIVNEQRQIVYINQALSKMLGIKDIDECLGLRQGEIFGCVNSTLSPDGCGAADQCSYCNAVGAVIECLERNEKVSRDFHIRTQNDTMEMNITASPLPYGDKRFILLMLQDISASNRKKVLEKIFFHDVINTAGALLSALELINENPSENSDLFPLLGNAARMLYEEIQSQKILSLAEANELKIAHKVTDLPELLHNVKKLLSTYSIFAGKCIQLSGPESLHFTTDPVLLERVIVNMLKNAVEASGENQHVEIRFGVDGTNVYISVFNEDVMPESVRYQIFHKTFSTKGKGRGVGTYSIKLLTERFLGGKVHFSSDDKTGTVFTVTLPVSGISSGLEHQSQQ